MHKSQKQNFFVIEGWVGFRVSFCRRKQTEVKYGSRTNLNCKQIFSSRSHAN